MPRGTRVLGIRLEGGTAVVDLSREVVTNHPGGSSGEIQTVYSIINTIALNFAGVREVQILVEGSVAKTLAGHLDITMPLGPDTGLVRKKKTIES
jgi:spore germination protein GerM